MNSFNLTHPTEGGLAAEIFSGYLLRDSPHLQHTPPMSSHLLLSTSIHVLPSIFLSSKCHRAHCPPFQVLACCFILAYAGWLPFKSSMSFWYTCTEMVQWGEYWKGKKAQAVHCTLTWRYSQEVNYQKDTHPGAECFYIQTRRQRDQQYSNYTYADISCRGMRKDFQHFACF